MAELLPPIEGPDFAKAAVGKAYLITRMARAEQGPFDMLLAEQAMISVIFNAIADEDPNKYEIFRNFASAQSPFTQNAEDVLQMARNATAAVSNNPLDGLDQDKTPWYHEGPQAVKADAKNIVRKPRGLLLDPIPALESGDVKDKPVKKEKKKKKQQTDSAVKQEGVKKEKGTVKQEGVKKEKGAVKQEAKTAGKFEIARYASQLTRLLADDTMDYRSIEPPDEGDAFLDPALYVVSDIVRDLHDLDSKEDPDREEYAVVRKARLDRLAELRGDGYESPPTETASTSDDEEGSSSDDTF